MWMGLSSVSSTHKRTAGDIYTKSMKEFNSTRTKFIVLHIQLLQLRARLLNHLRQLLHAYPQTTRSPHTTAPADPKMLSCKINVSRWSAFIKNSVIRSRISSSKSLKLRSKYYFFEANSPFHTLIGASDSIRAFNTNSTPSFSKPIVMMKKEKIQY